MWPFRCEKIKNRKKRIEEKINILYSKAEQRRQDYFVLERLFGEMEQGSHEWDRRQFKFKIAVACLCHGICHSFFTNHELIYDTVKKLIKEYEDFKKQIKKLEYFIEIIK